MTLQICKLCSLSVKAVSTFQHFTAAAMFKQNRLPLSSYTGMAYYEGQDVDLADVKVWLSKFDGGQVLFKRDESSGIAEIILDHPGRRNAMSGSMMAQLGDIVDNLENWSNGKGILWRGEGNMFCSGGDLNFAKASASAEGGFKMACYMHNVLSRFKALPMVSAALIHGQGAIGGGAEIATACDWRLMTKDCKGIGMVHTRMGIVPAWGASSRLATILGTRRALELITSSRIVAPEESQQMGLIDAIVDPGVNGNGLTEGLAWLAEHVQADAQVLRTAKATMTCYDELMGYSEVLERERRLFAPLWGGPANQRALRSHIKHLK